MGVLLLSCAQRLKCLLLHVAACKRGVCSLVWQNPHYSLLHFYHLLDSFILLTSASCALIAAVPVLRKAERQSA